MPTLDYQTPGPVRRRRPLSWSYWPPFVIAALTVSYVGFAFSAHGGDGVWLVLAVAGPALLCALPFHYLSEQAFLIVLPLAAIAQFTAYFAVLRTGRPRLTWAVVAFHLTCCAALTATGYLM